MAKITIDSKAKAIYVQIREGKVVRTKEFAEHTFADLDSNGHLLGVELLRPSGVLTIREVAHKLHRPILARIAPELESLYGKLAGAR